jgi:hypothetical protein
MTNDGGLVRYKIVLGDWSGDGHGISETYYVDVTGPHTIDQLRENYQCNVAALGFSPHDIAEEYEDSSIKPEHAEKLLEAGIDPNVVNHDLSTQEDYDKKKAEYAEFDTYGTAWRAVEKFWLPGARTIDATDMIDICMFFVLNGLDDVNYEIVKDETPTLLGGWDGFQPAPGEHASFIGYGLFTN